MGIRIVIGICVVFWATAVRGGPNVEDKGQAPGAAAAMVGHRVAEAELTTVRLSPEAEKRLGIQTTKVEQRDVARTRTLPGEIIVPHGRSVILSAPVAAYVKSGTDDDDWPQAGMPIDSHQPILRLATGGAVDVQAISPSDRISLAKAKADLSGATAEISGEITQAEVRVQAAKVKLQRTEVLRREEVGSQRAYDEAGAEFELAQSALQAAKHRLNVISRVLDELESGREASLPILSPFKGIVRFVHVVQSQIVPAGTPLVEIIAPDPLWVRVPVYAGEIPNLDTAGGAKIGRLADHPGDRMQAARPVTPGPSADPLAASVDLFFEVPNPHLFFQPGERVGVVLPTKTSTNSLVVPRSALLYDFSGGTWVYEQTAPQTYVRRRVEVRDVIGEGAALTRGPAVGAKVVTDGAAELFGTEFGAGK